MKFSTFLTIIFAATLSFAQTTRFGGFSDTAAFIKNTLDVIDSTFAFSPIQNSVDSGDPDFRLEHRNERGRMRHFRGVIFAFTDGKHYYIADATHALGSPRFRRLTRCEDFSFFRRVQKTPSGTGGHFRGNMSEVWVVLEHTSGAVWSITERNMRQFLLRRDPSLFNEFSDRNRREGNITDYLMQVCGER